MHLAGRIGVVTNEVVREPPIASPKMTHHDDYRRTPVNINDAILRELRERARIARGRMIVPDVNLLIYT